MNDDKPIDGQLTVEDAIQPKQEAYPNLNAGSRTAEDNIENKWAMKYKTPEDRQRLCREYCEHVEKGYTDDAFSGCDMQTFKKYFKEFPTDFDTELIYKARTARRQFWERIGINGSMGIPATYKNNKNELIESKGKFNDRSWKFIMGNMFNWREKTDITTNDETIKMPTVFIPKEVEE